MSFYFHKQRRRRLAEAQKAQEMAKAVEPVETVPEVKPVKKGRVKKDAV